jgi:hypothetical protein
MTKTTDRRTRLLVGRRTKHLDDWIALKSWARQDVLRHTETYTL